MDILDSIFIKITNIFHRVFKIWEYIYYLLFYSRPQLNIKISNNKYLILTDKDFERIALLYHDLFPHKVKEKIKGSDLICEHIFDFMGSGPIKIDTKGKTYGSIDWHSDFKIGYRWNPKKFYRYIRFGHIEGPDIKIPWELSRFQHLNLLGQSYILTEDKKYADEFASQIRDWIKNNPVGWGVNWNCTMEVAIRAVNLLVAQEYFSDERLLPGSFWQEFYSNIYEHGKFIWRHLEKHFKSTNNHYLADLAGLFFIATYCPFFKESEKWREYAINELTEEIEKQIFPDGCTFETSTCYHRLVLELLFYTELLGSRSGIKFPKLYNDRVRKMFECSLYFIKPNGEIPQIGDNDSGRFLVFCTRPILEHKYLLNLATIYYRDSEFKLSRFSYDEESFWIFGMEGKKIYDNIPFRQNKVTSKEFPNAGWYIMRHDDNYCFITCGLSGQNQKGGHSHNDKLSFELMFNNKDIVVDPGTYVYTSYPKERNKFRSTEFHNTLYFNPYEQNELNEKRIFRLPEKVKIKKAILLENKNNIIFKGEIQYSNIVHNRMITLNKKTVNLNIKDRFYSRKPLNGRLIFHLSPKLLYRNNYLVERKNKNKIAYIKIQGLEIKKEKYDYSPEYGVKLDATRLISDISSTKKNYDIISYFESA